MALGKDNPGSDMKQPYRYGILNNEPIRYPLHAIVIAPPPLIEIKSALRTSKHLLRPTETIRPDFHAPSRESSRTLYPSGTPLNVPNSFVMLWTPSAI